MLLKSLRMKNFRQFKGEQFVEFSCDPKNNVTVILGDNTSGKTTLLQAFNWCLYGAVEFETKDFLLNLEVSHGMTLSSSEQVEVEICLIHNNTEYVITRIQDYICEARGIRVIPLPQPNVNNTKVSVSFKQSDGQTEPIRQTYVEQTIREILPKELSGYFFFDTERIGSISNKPEVNDAVKGLLGLTTLSNAMEHLNKGKNSVIGKFKGGMDLAGNQKAADALNRMQSEQEKKQAIAEKLANVNSEILHYEKKKEQLDEILRDNQPTSAMQNRKEKLERDISHETTSLENAYKQFVREFNVNTTYFYAQPLMKRALDFLKEAKVDDKGIKDMTALSIADIIKRGRCVCGTEIIEGNDAFKQLLVELDFIPPQSIGTVIGNFKDKIASNNSTIKYYFRNLQSKYEEIYRSKNRIQEWQDEVDNISTQIRGKENSRKYQIELDDVKKRLKDFYEKKEREIRNDEGCNREIERYQKIYDSLVGVSGKNLQILICVKYAEEIYTWIETNYREKEQVIREKLESKINNIFSKMYHGHRKVTIDEKYRVTLLTAYADEDIKTDESKGLETVKNFAFIAGIVDLAREKIISKSGDDSIEFLSEPYPLVMDAPFSNADEKHVGNISKVLPEVAQQVIMFVMSKDWHFAENVMGQYVGKHYVLDKKSETLTYIRRSEQ